MQIQMNKVLLHCTFMMECGEPSEAYSYITRATICTFGPDSKVHNCVCATNSDSSLPAMDLRANLHNIRHKMLGSVTGFGGSKFLDSVGDAMIPYHIAGSSILMTVVV